jgi:hypothetical protein
LRHAAAHANELREARTLRGAVHALRRCGATLAPGV